MGSEGWERSTPNPFPTDGPSRATQAPLEHAKSREWGRGAGGPRKGPQRRSQRLRPRARRVRMGWVRQGGEGSKVQPAF